MKTKMHLLISLLLLAVAFASCDKDSDEPEVKATLSVEPVTLSFTPQAGESHEVVVATNQSSWDAVSSQTWCIVTKGNGKFTVTATSNTSTSSPTSAVITVTAGTAKPVTISVTQSGVGAELSVNIDTNTPVSFTNTGGDAETKTITVTTNQSSWNVTSSQTWCTLNKSGNAFTIIASANTGAESRSAVVTVSAANVANVTINVTQAGVGASLSVSPNTAITLSKDGGASEAKIITVTTNQSSWNAVASQAWCTVSKSGNQFTITASANIGSTERTATITVSAGSASNVTIEVTQAAPTYSGILSVSSDTPILLDASVWDVRTIQITTDQCDWSGVSDATWCLVSKCPDGENNLFISAEQNSAATPRGPATVTITAGNAMPVTLTVTQSAAPPDPDIAFVARNPVTEALYTNGFFMGSRVNFDLVVYDDKGNRSITITEVAKGAPNGNSREIRKTRVIQISGQGTYPLSQEMWNGNPMYANVYNQFSYTVSAYGKSYTKTYSGSYSSFNGAWSHYFGK